MGWRVLGTLAAGVVGLSLPACGAAEFTCEADVQCVGQGEGVCQPDGHCSFPDAECPSGQRYGQHSGANSGQCVGEGGAASSTSGESPTSATRSTTAPATSDSGPGLESGEPDGSADGTTAEPSTSTGPAVVTTGQETGTSDVDTGEPVDPDLVLWLALDRAPVGVVLDSSTYMGNGECEAAGCPEGGRGFVGGGASFDGTDDVIRVPHAEQLETTDAYTIAAFIRVGGVPLDFRGVMAKPYGPALENSWEIYFQYEQLHTGMSNDVGEYWEVMTEWTFPPDEWVHVAATWDGGLLTLWLDGQSAGEIEVPGIVFDEQAVHVGADDDHDLTGPTGYFLGSIDDVRVYRRALTADELATLAAG
jgi:hypothetical protein